MSFSYSIITGISVKNTEVHAETLNVITAITLSDTDNMVVVGTDENLLIFLITTMPSCVKLELVIFIVGETWASSHKG